jgi:hypothetical protein
MLACISGELLGGDCHARPGVAPLPHGLVRVDRRAGVYSAILSIVPSFAHSESYRSNPVSAPERATSSWLASSASLHQYTRQSADLGAVDYSDVLFLVVCERNTHKHRFISLRFPPCLFLPRVTSSPHPRWRRLLPNQYPRRSADY